MKPATLLTGSVLLVLLAPAAAADISILGGTAIIHTDGDPGLSVLGNPVARVVPTGSCFPGWDECTFVYGDPAGLGDYMVAAHVLACGDWDACVLVVVVNPVGPNLGAAVLVSSDPAVVWACHVVDCVYITADPLCVSNILLGEIVCDT